MSFTDLNEKQRKHGEGLGVLLTTNMMLTTYAYHQGTATPIVLLFLYVFAAACLGMGMGRLLGFLAHMPLLDNFLWREIMRPVIWVMVVLSYMWTIIVFSMFVLVAIGNHSWEWLATESLYVFYMIPDMIPGLIMIAILRACLIGVGRLIRLFISLFKAS